MAQENSLPGVISNLHTFGPGGPVSHGSTGANPLLQEFDPQGNTAHRLYASGSVLSTVMHDSMGSDVARVCRFAGNLYGTYRARSGANWSGP